MKITHGDKIKVLVIGAKPHIWLDILEAGYAGVQLRLTPKQAWKLADKLMRAAATAEAEGGPA
jgi:hypothetical protein